MEAGEGDELEGVAHRGELALEAGDVGVVEGALPVERRRAVVGELLVRVLRLHVLGDGAGELDVRDARLHPEHVGDLEVRLAAGEDGLDAGLHLVEALGGALAGDEGAVALVDVARHEVRGERVGAGDDDARHARDVGREAGGLEGALVLRGGDEHLAAHVAALLLRAELVLPVDARGARLDHRLHELVGVELAAEAGLGVGDDRGEPVALGGALLGDLDLVGAEQRVVDATDDGGHRVRRVERLVRVGVRREVRVGGDLPAGEVDGLEAGAHLLHGLVAGERAERVRPLAALLVRELPELLSAAAGEGVLLDDRAAEGDDVLGAVVAADVRPARVLVPVALDVGGGGVRGAGAVGHVGLLCSVLRCGAAARRGRGSAGLVNSVRSSAVLRS
ncbi:hypothetical protein USB125703_00001 [Pseudoclavibacter triregionum]|nr:hypothetical protein USB125703_00001 [Pseudoclavibacter triregionum]